MNIDPVAFSIFGKDIYWYGITMASGVLFGLLLAMRSASLYKWKKDDLLDFMIFAVPIGLICARLYYVAFEWEYYAQNPISILYVWEGGLALYGSLIGAVLTAVVFCKIKKYKVIDLLDIGAPAFALGQAIGRWGNFFNQEAYGDIITNPALTWFPFAVKIQATGTIHYATFFYESMWCLFIAGFLTIFRKKFKHAGDIFAAYLALYGFERMIVEGLRTDSLYILNTGIRVSQLLSGILFLAAVAYLTFRWVREIKMGITITNKANPLYDWGDIDNLQEVSSEIDQLNSQEISSEIDQLNTEIVCEQTELAQEESGESKIATDALQEQEKE